VTSKRRKRARRPARRNAIRSQRRRLLVVCEGERTEPDYLRGFERHVRNATIELEVLGEGLDPKRIVEAAKSRNDNASGEARRLRDGNARFDEVWCVFDRDEHPSFDAARVMARDNKFELAISNPSVELWLLLHFRDSPGMQHRDAIRQMLKRLLPHYDKRVDFEEFVGGVADATARAQRLDEAATAAGEAHRNPSTGFYRLTDSIARSPDE